MRRQSSPRPTQAGLIPTHVLVYACKHEHGHSSTYLVRLYMCLRRELLGGNMCLTCACRTCVHHMCTTHVLYVQKHDSVQLLILLLTLVFALFALYVGVLAPCQGSHHEAHHSAASQAIAIVLGPCAKALTAKRLPSCVASSLVSAKTPHHKMLCDEGSWHMAKAGVVKRRIETSRMETSRIPTSWVSAQATWQDPHHKVGVVKREPVGGP